MGGRSFCGAFKDTLMIIALPHRHGTMVKIKVVFSFQRSINIVKM